MLVHPRLFVSSALVAILTLAAPRAQAQCGPDGIAGGPCCTAAAANLPAIPAMQLDCRSICFNGCNVSQQFLDCVNLGAHVPAMNAGAIQCGVFDFRFRVKTCGTATFLYNGVLKAFYSRTWNEFPVVGATPIQVWRFVVNGDLLPTAALPTGICRKPPCTAPGNFTRVYFSGYIDYAYDCNANTWSVAFAISHECDAIHHPAGSARPGVFHATRSYSIVGPGTGFVPASTGTVQSSGAITSGAVRWNQWTPAPAIGCNHEEPVSGAFLAGNNFCSCIATGALQYINTSVNATSGLTGCGSAVSPDPGGTQFIQKRIGGWTNPAVFPGQEFALFDFGYLRYANGCSTATPPSREWFEGGETIGGWMAVDLLSGGALDPEFEDLGSCNLSKTNAAVRIGGPHISNYMMHFNLP